MPLAIFAFEESFHCLDWFDFMTLIFTSLVGCESCVVTLKLAMKEKFKIYDIITLYSAYHCAKLSYNIIEFIHSSHWSRQEKRVSIDITMF